MTLELAMYFLSGVLFVVCCLIAVIWNDNKAKLQEHARQIELKANGDKLAELDLRLEKELTEMARYNEKLIEKLENRQLRDIEIVSSNFREQVSGLKEAMQAMEKNILQQMSIMFSARDNK